MANIDLTVCDTIDDYKLGQCVKTSFRTNKIDLIRHAITLGNLSSHTQTSAGERFYRSFVDMFFDGKLNVRNDYLMSESSLVTSYSFLMGMIITKDIAEKRYNIPNLFHLNEDFIKYTTVKDKGNHPDYFGFNKYERPYLFEAKGRKSNKLTKTSRVGIPEIDKAKNQLLNVHITWEDRVTYLNFGIRKHIVQSLFFPNFHIWDIDPPSEKKNDYTDIIVEIDLASNLNDYYKNIFEIIKKESKNVYKQDINGATYNLIKRKSYLFGLREDIYENLVELEKTPKKDGYVENHFNLVNKTNVVSKSIQDDEKISIGQDGVIIKEN